MAYRVLPAEALPAAPRGSRPLSRRAVKRTVRIGQVWVDRDGRPWRIANIHRTDGQVHLEASGHRSDLRTFGELGHAYTLAEDPARGP